MSGRPGADSAGTWEVLQVLEVSQKRAPTLFRYPAPSSLVYPMDITARLIWYKLGELREKMAEAGKSWYTELDFDSYVLDLLLLGWCTLSILVVLSVNALVAAFGPRQKQPLESFRETKGEDAASNKPLPVESAQWFNSGLNWFYLHYYHSEPQFIGEWLAALNLQANRLGVSLSNLNIFLLNIDLFIFKYHLNSSLDSYSRSLIL